MPLRVVLLSVGAALGLWARSTSAASAGISFADRTSWGSIYLLVVGWFLMVAAVVVLPERRRSALLLYAIGVWWFVNELASPAVGLSLMFTVGLVLFATGPALVAHLALGYPTARLQGRPSTVIVVCGYAVMLGVIGVAGTTVFDPQTTGCLDCPTNLLLFSAHPAVADWVDLIGVGLGAVWLLLALGAVAWRAVSAGRGVRGSVGSIAGCAAIFLGASAAQFLASLPHGGLGSGGPGSAVWRLQGASLLVLAVATCVDMWRARRARRNLTRLVVDLRGASPGGLRAALAERFGDRDLVLAYPIEDGRRYVDAEAHDLDVTPTPDRSATQLVQDGVHLATLLHKPGILTQTQQVNDLIVSVRLALESERLTAEDRAQLAQIRSSGARIVAAGDAERRRIERDLHDAAQQRLVALLLTLRLIRREVPLPILEAALAELRLAIADLRQLAHGVFPVLLKDAGLRAALDGLAESRRLVVEVDADERYPDVVETTVYLLIARLSDAGPTSARIGRDDSMLLLEASLAGRPEALGEPADRIRTLGGHLDLTMNEEVTRMTLALPIEADFHDSHARRSQREQ